MYIGFIRRKLRTFSQFRWKSGLSGRFYIAPDIRIMWCLVIKIKLFLQPHKWNTPQSVYSSLHFAWYECCLAIAGLFLEMSNSGWSVAVWRMENLVIDISVLICVISVYEWEDLVDQLCRTARSLRFSNFGTMVESYSFEWASAKHSSRGAGALYW